jgi:hypothetical protein
MKSKALLTVLSILLDMASWLQDVQKSGSCPKAAETQTQSTTAAVKELRQQAKQLILMLQKNACKTSGRQPVHCPCLFTDEGSRY